MPAYKLIYFDIVGLGEMIRFLFSYGNIEFEDYRISSEDWATIKPTLTWGQLPILEIDGKQFNQSLAIARYLSNIVGLSGKNAMDELKINIAVDTINDWRIATITPIVVMDTETRHKNIKTVTEEYLPSILPKLDVLVKDNGGYFALGRLTIADIYFASFAPYACSFCKKNIFDEYENLSKLIKTVESIPSIKKWIENRPPRIAYDLDVFFQKK